MISDKTISAVVSKAMEQHAKKVAASAVEGAIERKVKGLIDEEVDKQLKNLQKTIAAEVPKALKAYLHTKTGDRYSGKKTPLQRAIERKIRVKDLDAAVDEFFNGYELAFVESEETE